MLFHVVQYMLEDDVFQQFKSDAGDGNWSVVAGFVIISLLVHWCYESLGPFPRDFALLNWLVKQGGEQRSKFIWQFFQHSVRDAVWCCRLEGPRLVQKFEDACWVDLENGYGRLTWAQPWKEGLIFYGEDWLELLQHDPGLVCGSREEFLVSLQWWDTDVVLS